MGTKANIVNFHGMPKHRRSSIIGTDSNFLWPSGTGAKRPVSVINRFMRTAALQSILLRTATLCG